MSTYITGIEFDDEEIIEQIEEYHERQFRFSEEPFTPLPQSTIDEMLFRIKDYIIGGIGNPIENAYSCVLEEIEFYKQEDEAKSKELP